MQALRITFILGILLATSAFGASSRIPKGAEQSARAAAVSWLHLVDNRKYAASWKAAAPLFKQRVEQQDWVSNIKKGRGFVGAFKSRTFDRAQYKTKLPNAPKGEYVVIQFKSSFSQRPSAYEVVTVAKTDQQGWKVAGYFIR